MLTAILSIESCAVLPMSGDPAALDTHRERAHEQWTAESEQSYAAMSEEEERRQRRVDVRALHPSFRAVCGVWQYSVCKVHVWMLTLQSSG